MSSEVDLITAKIRQLQAQRRELLKDPTVAKSLAQKRKTFGLSRADLELELQRRAIKMRCRFVKVNSFVYAYIDDETGTTIRFAVRSSKDWFDRLPMKQKDKLTLRSWHTISQERLDMLARSVDFVVFAVSSRTDGALTVFVLPIDEVIRMSKQAGRMVSDRVMFYFAADKAGNALECRLNQRKPLKLKIKPNNWGMLNPKGE